MAETDVATTVDEAKLKKAEEFVAQEEGAANRLKGWIGYGVSALAVATTLFHLSAAYDIVPTLLLRPVHVGLVLVLIFLLFPVAMRFRDGIRWWDLAAAAASIFTIGYTRRTARRTVPPYRASLAARPRSNSAAANPARQSAPGNRQVTGLTSVRLRIRETPSRKISGRVSRLSTANASVSKS